MKNVKYYICKHCGNLVEVVNDGKVNPVCCGEKMSLLEPGTVEASHEKHIPVISAVGGDVKVFVGSIEHPMSEEHSILWISLLTDKGLHRVHLSPSDKPEAHFYIAGETPIAAYAYCNLHGLWKVDF